MSVWAAMEKLNTLVDDADVDTSATQIEHLLQTAEAIRRDGKPEWMQVVGVVHDLGKLLYFLGSECVVAFLPLLALMIFAPEDSGMWLVIPLSSAASSPIVLYSTRHFPAILIHRTQYFPPKTACTSRDVDWKMASNSLFAKPEYTDLLVLTFSHDFLGARRGNRYQA